MKDKDIYNLVDDVEEVDKLDFDYNDWQEADLSDKDIEKIKNKTYEKIGKSKVKKNKNRKLLGFVASISLVVLLGSSIVFALVGNKYKYDSASGQIIKSESPIYILEEPMNKKVNDGEIIITSFIANPDEEHIVVNLEMKNIKGYEYIKHEIKVNGKDILNNSYDKLDDYSGTASIGGIYEYSEGDKIIFSVLLKDSSNKVNHIDFNIDLVEATSMEQYNKYLPNDTNNNVTVSAIAKEEKDILYIDLKAIPNVDSLDFQLDSFGNYMVINNKTNMFLTDANGKKVELEPEVEDSSGTNFNVNIKDLQKPFTLDISHINVEADNLRSVKVKLPYLKLDQRKKINKVINIGDSNNIISKESSKVLIKSVKRTNHGEVDYYNMNLDYPDNENASIKLRSLNIDPVMSPINLFRSNMIGSSQTASLEDYICRDTTVDFSKSDKEYAKESFYISGFSYTIEGKWKLKID